MGKKVRRVSYRLDPQDVKELPLEEIRAILRGADDLVGTGGRSLLARIMKGSRDKKLLGKKLDENPVYGYYRDLTLAEITARIDRVILDGYLDIIYNYRLPVLIFSDKGWAIEKETYAEELLGQLKELLPGGDYSFVRELKDRNRQVILLLLDKIEATGDRRFIHLLQAWPAIDYKKVRQKINKVITVLEAGSGGGRE